MTRRRDQFDYPERHALHREAALVSKLTGSGSTALGGAGHADKPPRHEELFMGYRNNYGFLLTGKTWLQR
jgi:hypothetical protein